MSKRKEAKGRKLVSNEEEPIQLDNTEDEFLPGSGTADVTADEPFFSVFVGTELGILKGICLGGELPISKSIYRPEVMKQKPPAVRSLTWVDEEEKELLVCFSNHVVKTYNTKMRCFTRQIQLEIEDDAKLAGLCCHDSGKYVIGLEDGTVGMWDCLEASMTLNFKTGDDMRRIRQCDSDKNFYATGGKENDLKIWDISSEKPEVPVFKAKNVPHDFLDLRVPVWVQDLTFLPRTSEVVAVGTRYGQIRLYDVRESQRPMSNVQFADHAIMSITSTMNDRQVVVGTAKGEAGLYDLRNPGKEKLLRKFVGFAGSIRSMVASPEEPYVVSCGLDRHVYIHKLSEKEQVKKLYMNQQLNCIAISKSFMKELKPKSEEEGEEVRRAMKIKGDWANIPPDVLCINEEYLSPKKSRKTITS